MVNRGVGSRIRGAGLAVQQSQAGLGHVLSQNHHTDVTVPKFLAISDSLQAGEFHKAGSDDHGDKSDHRQARNGTFECPLCMTASRQERVDDSRNDRGSAIQRLEWAFAS
jgi:hypothetical protein